MSPSKLPTTLIIVGITGDLAGRKLLPAIASLAAAGALPEKFRIIGLTRRDVTTADVMASLPKAVPAADRQFLEDHILMHKIDLSHQADYEHLEGHLKELESEDNGESQRLFYLSVPPQVSQPIVSLLGATGLAKVPNTKLLLEKPFGSDYESAKDFIEHVSRYFDESQVYRIDHYLAKEMAQNIVVFRGKNSLFKRTWNKDFIEKIEIISAEEIGVEGRATFYEQTGALRDVVQSHLLQLAALTLMELPEEAQWDTIPACRLAALHQLHSAAEHMSNHAMRGQYEGYRDEVGNSHSHTETFASLILESNDPNWMGVPIRIIAGKALAFKRTEIIIHFRRDTQHEANQLILRIQPDEGVELVLWSKKPGLDREMEMVKLDYQYEHHDIIPEAYERVFLDAINSDHSLFATSDEVLASWKILAPIQQAWSMHSDLIMYPVGSTPSEILIEAAN